MPDFPNSNIAQDIVEFAKINNIFATPEAILEMDHSNYKKIIEYASSLDLFVLDKKLVDEWKLNNPNITSNLDNNIKNNENVLVEVQKTKYIYAKDIDSDIKINHESDITNRMSTSGKIGEFFSYFEERYLELSKIITNRPSITTPIKSKELLKLNKNEEVTLIGMMMEKSTTKNENIMFTFDDLEGQFRVVVLKKDELLTDVARNILDDDVVAIKGSKLSDNIIIAKEIEFPDMKSKPTNKAQRDVYAISTSDIHVGSKLFFDKEFDKFIDWISMKNVSDSEFEYLSRVKYLFVAGDSVDGVGVYPQQNTELDIFSIYEQYDVVAKFLERIPEHIEIIFGPGNHDAVRLADPQPSVSKKFAKPLHDMSNVHMVSSPVSFEVEGLKTLMYHGNSMFSLQGPLKLDFSDPTSAMKEYLKRRDLAPIYGSRHPVLPEKGGYMLIKEEPDIFITGHIHKNAYDFYKGCLLVNSGTWQAQSIFQREQGHIPSPGRVPIYKLNENKVFEKVFMNAITKE